MDAYSTYGKPISESIAEAVQTARGIGSLIDAKRTRERQGVVDQRAAAEYERQQAARMKLAEHKGNLESFFQDPNALRYLTQDEIIHGQQVITAKRMQDRLAAKEQRDIAQQEAERAALGTTLENIPQANAENYIVPGENVVPLEAIRAAGEAYQIDNADTEALRSFAPAARAGAFDSGAAPLLQAVGRLPGDRMRASREIRLASENAQKEERLVAQEAQREATRLAVEESRRKAQESKDAAAEKRLQEQIASNERIANSRNDALLKGIAAKGEQKLQVNAAEEKDIGVIAKTIANGEAYLSDFGKRSPQFQAKIVAAVKEISPDYDFGEAEANKKQKQNVNINKALQLLNSVEATMPEFMKANERLGLTRFPAWNRIKLFAMKNTGDPDYTAFVNWRNSYSMELANALSGAAATDMRIKQELENINTAASPAQFKAAYDVLKRTIEARKEAFKQPPYPTKGGKSDPLGLR